MESSKQNTMTTLSSFSSSNRPRGGIQLNIKYSKLFALGTNETTTSWLTGWQIEKGKPDSLHFKVGLKHNSKADNATFQLKLYSKVVGNDGDVEFSLLIAGDIVIPNSNKLSYVQSFSQMFTTKAPDSQFFDLLTHDVLSDPNAGYYDQKKDELKVNIPLFF